MTAETQPEWDAAAGPSLSEVARGVSDEIGLTAPRRSASPSLSAAEIFALIQESAYFKAEARGFSPGYEEQDWLKAEAEIKSRMGMSDRRGGD